MRHLPIVHHPDLLVGTEHGDDALVWRRPDGRALVATCDFFAPVVDDARTWGMIAAANAASDVYAMGGTPLFALNLVSWPAALDLDLLGEVMAGGSEMAARGGWVVAGGHTVDGPEPHYGQSVVGEVDPDRILTNAGGLVGQHLVLTKALGTGLIATALKRSDGLDDALRPAYEAAVASMTTLNDHAARIALDSGATTCTDVTGFGLIGHLHKMARASNVAARIDTAALPLLTGARELAAAGMVPGGTTRNLDWVGDHLISSTADDMMRVLAGDPQTSGGLLFACDPGAAIEAVAAAQAAGLPAAVIGELVAPGSMPGRVELA